MAPSKAVLKSQSISLEECHTGHKPPAPSVEHWIHLVFQSGVSRGVMVVPCMATFQVGLILAPAPKSVIHGYKPQAALNAITRHS